MEAELYQKYYDGWYWNLVREANPDDFKKLFDRAFGSDSKTNDWYIKCLRHGLPFNMGSKSDMFLYPNSPLAIRVLELFREYKVPVIFETKSVFAGLRSYLDIIKDLHCAVIVSVMGGSDTLNYRLEPGAPVASSRWQFVGEMNRLGIWTAVRWEPIMPTINASDEDLEGFAKNAKKYKARHVSLYHYRSSDYYGAAERFKAAGFDYVKMLEASLDEKWKPVGQKLFDYLRQEDIPASSPDFVNFPFRSDCLSCCGTDELFKPYLFNFQYALSLIRKKGFVEWEDMENVGFIEMEAYRRMKDCWNGGGGIYNLTDVTGIHPVDKDEHGMNIYQSYERIPEEPNTKYLPGLL
jgi:hypothetical protein